MDKSDAQEAVPIMQRALRVLLAAAPTRGRPGSDLRSACGYLMTNALVLLRNDEAGPPLADCFRRAFLTGISRKQLSYVRQIMAEEMPRSVGAILIKNSIIRMSLATEGRIVADMQFRSREAVEQLKKEMNEALKQAAEIAANDMDAMTYQALVSLHAAIINHLVETARPLPRMIRFAFAAPMPSLVTAQRLYYDGSRADELKDENDVVHPAFMPATGRALSA